jgi:hypothetical protein
MSGRVFYETNLAIGRSFVIKEPRRRAAAKKTGTTLPKPRQPQPGHLARLSQAWLCLQ